MTRMKCMRDPFCIADADHDGPCDQVAGSTFAMTFAVSADDEASIAAAVRCVHDHLVAHTPNRIGPVMATVSGVDDMASVQAAFDAAQLDQVDRVALTAAAMAFRPSVIVCGYVPTSSPRLN